MRYLALLLLVACAGGPRYKISDCIEKKDSNERYKIVSYMYTRNNNTAPEAYNPIREFYIMYYINTSRIVKDEIITPMSEIDHDPEIIRYENMKYRCNEVLP